MRNPPDNIMRKIHEKCVGRRTPAKQVVHVLLTRITRRAERGANELLRKMSESKYHVLAVHKEGSEDKTSHFTVYIKRGGRFKGYHVRLDGRGVVWQITDLWFNEVRDLGVVPPWMAPGRGPR